MQHRTAIFWVTVFMTTTLLGTEVFGHVGLFKRKHRHPLTQATEKPRQRIVENTLQAFPIVLAFDSLKSLEENGPVYILKIKLFNNGIVELSTSKHQDKFDHSDPGEPLGKTTIKLSSRQMYLVLQQVKTIANTPLNIKTKKHLCGVIPSIDKGIKSLYSVRNFNSINNTFTAGLKLVESTKGCWAKYSVSPKENQLAFENLRNLLNAHVRPSIAHLISK